jgi:hypothetical protein
MPVSRPWLSSLPAALLLAAALLAACAPTEPRNGAGETMDAETGTVAAGHGAK